MSSHSASDSGMQKMMIIVAIALSLLTVTIVITARTLSSGSNDEFDTLLHNAKVERIQPVARVRTEAPVVEEVAAASAAMARSGEELASQGVCAGCHNAGVGGAPLFTDTAAWATRAEAGLEALVASVVNGKGGMPARGGSDYTDEEITRAVEYMTGLGNGGVVAAAEEPAAEAPAAEAPATEEAAAEEAPATEEAAAEAPAEEAAVEAPAVEAAATEDAAVAEAPAAEEPATEETAAEAPAAEAAPEAEATAEAESAEEPAAEAPADTDTAAAESAAVAAESTEAAATETEAATAESTEGAAAVEPAPAEGVIAALTPRIQTTIDQGVCAGCHISGIAGAPKYGDVEAWAARAEKGYAALAATVASGKGAMPPRGGSDLTDDELLIAVEYMVQKNR